MLLADSRSMYSYTTSSGTGMSSVDDHHSRESPLIHALKLRIAVLNLEYWSNSPSQHDASIVYSHYKRSPHAHTPAFGQTRISTASRHIPQLPLFRLSSVCPSHGSRSTSRSRASKEMSTMPIIDRLASTASRHSPQPPPLQVVLRLSPTPVLDLLLGHGQEKRC